jgi:hypothetical protein
MKWFQIEIIPIFGAYLWESGVGVLALGLHSAVLEAVDSRGMMTIRWGRRLGAGVFVFASVFAAGDGVGISVADAQTADAVSSG